MSGVVLGAAAGAAAGTVADAGGGSSSGAVEVLPALSTGGAAGAVAVARAAGKAAAEQRRGQSEEHGAVVSVLSYNVLLPNSSDGWWVYKYYDIGAQGDDGGTPPHAWPQRRELLEAQLTGSAADVICLQECCAESFCSDFAFLLDGDDNQAGAYGYELSKRGRMRNATLWRKDRLALVSCKDTGDRALVTRFRLAEGQAQAAQGGGFADSAMPPGAPQEGGLFVVNVHLTAGPAAARRLRQVHQALEVIRKLVFPPNHKGGGGAKQADVPPTPVIVCGDFNSEGQRKSAWSELLATGQVGPDFRQAGCPDEALTSKVKKHVLGPFRDAYEEAFGSSQVPPTMVVADLVDRMVDASSGKASAGMLAHCKRMFDEVADRSDGQLLGPTAIQRWLVTVNKELGRGSEFRKVQDILAAKAAADSPDADCLTLEEFVSVYQAELDQGKYWGVQHDVLAMTGQSVAERGAPPFTMVFDHVLYSQTALELVAVRESLTDQHAHLLRSGQAWLPCAWHPSDHLPIWAQFRICR